MELRQAIDIVLNEAETSALGDGNNEALEAVTLLHEFLEWVADDVKAWDKFAEDGYVIQSFLDDKERMNDFQELSKDQFLNKYPFTSEEEYNLTRVEEKDLTDTSI
jgi:2-polyprenyl-3-methyl-5-hydroxy-6-metoxy-1,4-benzoquinol methylase